MDLTNSHAWKQFEGFRNRLKHKGFKAFLRKNLFGTRATISTPFHASLPIIPCDSTATGYPLKVIEEFLATHVYPYYTNTHSNNLLGRYMLKLVEESKNSILNGVGGQEGIDRVIFTGSGSSGAVNHLVHLIAPRLAKGAVAIVSINEHYSNYLPWYENCAKVEVVGNDPTSGKIDVEDYVRLLDHWKAKGTHEIIVSFSACSNVTGVLQDVEYLAELCHRRGGLFFVDMAASAPYVPISMHANDATLQYFDGLFISPHKFVGAQSSPGLLVVRESIACNRLPFLPAGGTVRHVCKHQPPIYSKDMETRESGGSLNVLGVIRCGLAFEIKDHFQDEMLQEEFDMTARMTEALEKLAAEFPSFKLLTPTANPKRLPIFAFQIVPYHYNYIVALLSDLFGIMTRGGVNCSGLLAESLLGLNQRSSARIRSAITRGRGVPAPYGWVRLTLHSRLTSGDLTKIVGAIRYVVTHAKTYQDAYIYNRKSNLYCITSPTFPLRKE